VQASYNEGDWPTVQCPLECGGSSPTSRATQREPCQTSIEGWNFKKYRASETALLSSLACSS